MLTPFAHRKVVAEAARKHPTKIVPFGFVELDAPDVAQQVKELHDLGYRGLGELEFPRKPFVDRSYDPVYELANEYSWIVLFHTGIVLREVFDKPEDMTSARMRPVHLEEIARRFPRLTVLGAHCGNPEYEWAAEVSRWNPNVFFDLSGSTLQKMRGRLNHFQDIFWWSGVGQDTRHAQQRPERVHQAGVRLRHGSREDRDRRRHVPFALRRLRRAGLHTPDDSGRDDVADPSDCRPEAPRLRRRPDRRYRGTTVTTSEERLTAASSTPRRSITPQRAEMERYEGASHANKNQDSAELRKMPNSPRTGASRENSRIELDVRSRKSFSTTLSRSTCSANVGKLEIGSPSWARTAARRRASTLRNQPINGFQRALFWSISPSLPVG